MYTIKFLFNIEDKYLHLDKKIPFEELKGYKRAYLIQSYKIKCAIYRRIILKNSFKPIKVKTFPIIKKYLCKPSTNCS